MGVVYNKANSVFLVTRNQFKILVKIRKEIQILTIFYQLSEHLGMICFLQLGFF